MVYRPPIFLFNKHLETIYPALFRHVKPPLFEEVRIETPDDDFLDIYLFKRQSKKLVILTHGLEGNALRHYMMGMTHACINSGFDVLTWNFRSCGEEINRQLIFYHSGATEDLQYIIDYALTLGYNEINLIGFSLGGNLTLKYLGEGKVSSIIRKACVLSVPMDLYSSCQQISRPSNFIYSNRFLESLKSKIIRKAALRNELNITDINKINNLIDFDDRYTAPLHGFENALHYYHSCSSIRFVQNINIPTLIINAKNDPILSPQCYPEKLLKEHSFVKFESPARGGHVGFSQFNKNGLYWSEERAVDFLIQ